MDVEMLGHATILIRSGQTSILFDPLLYDTHHEGLYEIHPRRSLDFDYFPTLSAVVISHQHADHYDLQSLALLPANVPIFIPDDPLITAGLHELGFREIYTVNIGSSFNIDELVLLPTAPADGAVEFGFIVSDGKTAVWNIIDTLPSPSTIAGVMANTPLVDLAIVPWQPLLDELACGDRPLAFPMEHYRRLLENVWQINAAALVLGACGFCATQQNDWLNKITFPVSPSRFQNDVLAACPALQRRIFETLPGDRLRVENSGTTLERGVLPYCRLVPDVPIETRWRPWAGQFEKFASALTLGESACAVRLEDFFTEELTRFVRENAPEFSWHGIWLHRRQVTVYMRNSELSWTLVFDDNGVRVERGFDPLAQAHSVITGDSLVSLLERTRTWSHVVLAGHYWQMDFTYRVDGGRFAVPCEPLSCPLRIYFGGADHAAAVLHGRIQKAGQSEIDATEGLV